MALSSNHQVDLDLTRDALASSTLSHGLVILGDRWTVAILLHAFLGVRRFDDWQSKLGIPRFTLTQRLGALMGLGLLEQRAYQERPVRMAYHLTGKGLTLYSHVLMMWAWERRWGSRQLALPEQLLHRACGHACVPVLACGACHAKVGLNDLAFTLHVNTQLSPLGAGRVRGQRLSVDNNQPKALGLRVDRWALLIVAAILLGCHYFDALLHVLGIGSAVLSRRLASMVDSDLLICQVDLLDARRKVYRLTPASRDLFGYIVCFSSWASRHHFAQASAIAPTHKACGQPFVPLVVCSHCGQGLEAKAMVFDWVQGMKPILRPNRRSSVIQGRKTS
jgi:DNA-binding HxlR family transcriptional regulator